MHYSAAESFGVEDERSPHSEDCFAASVKRSTIGLLKRHHATSMAHSNQCRSRSLDSLIASTHRRLESIGSQVDTGLLAGESSSKANEGTLESSEVPVGGDRGCSWSSPWRLDADSFPALVPSRPSLLHSSLLTYLSVLSLLAKAVLHLPDRSPLMRVDRWHPPLFAFVYVFAAV